ncbi:superkiller protein 3 [Bathymodiolus platifrons methanotrophic gill symbiont]|uniref:tetratricopeptide repeat protein n=2 Tax=Bathymodiolus platifrons methanotrophic gill symbiont TaxID=113268 RepID=UPI000B6D9776|nr:tetratricopeptide repeat protein [Bathymodiolus platifrons methanotrophic gill symbiont]GAW87563.1 superkiller protein 3 [Bathymodiolus platifrons methanotrophic gill symbiont]GFO77252.1 hypothetical protein BPLS_P5586 [Bathymodiolus platifrons methanotrophic gill symbiont]
MNSGQLNMENAQKQNCSYWEKKAEDQYRRARYQESILSADNAIQLDENSVDGWWFSALSYQGLNDASKALNALEVVVDLAPHFANGWARYGAALQKIDDSDAEALDAFERAIQIDPDHETALTGLAELYRELDSKDHDDADKEIYVLSRLDDIQGGLTSNQLNRLGILYYNSKRFFEAIKYWDRNIQFNTEFSSLFNLGLVYNHPEVSQDADAVDIWRLTLKHHPDRTKVKDNISKLLPRLLVLAEEALQRGQTVLNHAQWYQNYINPFELLNYQDDQLIDSEDIDIKKIQKLRKRLIHELELEDGHIPWMESLFIDRSKVINLCDELNDEDKRSYHLHVFRNKPLLNFLTCGEHQHFIVDNTWSPLETLEFLEDTKNGFRHWLSEPFSKQFYIVITKAIENEDLAVIEVLLDGRRWIDPSYTEKCFENAKRKIDLQLEPLRNNKQESEKKKPTVNKLTNLLNEQSLIQILNLFPTFFWEIQDEAVGIIRNVAVSSFNIHGDSELAKEILNLTSQFSFKSEESNRRIQEDKTAIEKIIQEEKQYESYLTINEESCNVTRKGVRQGDKFISVDSIRSVRWGVMLSGNSSNPTHDFLFLFKSKDFVVIKFQWATTKSIKKQNEFNHQVIEAILQYIIPSIIENQIMQLNKGGSINIGHCRLTAQGIHFESKGLIFSKPQFIPWIQATFYFRDGELVVWNSHSKKVKTHLSLRDVDNAFTLKILKEHMC